MLDFGTISCYSSDMFRWSWTMYLRGDAGRISASHHVNLLLAPRKLLEKLPPTYVPPNLPSARSPFENEQRAHTGVPSSQIEWKRMKNMHAAKNINLHSM